MKSLELLEIENKEHREQNAELAAICRSLHCKRDTLTAEKKSLETSVATLKGKNLCLMHGACQLDSFV